MAILMKPEVWDQVHELRGRGLSYTQIGKKLALSPSCVGRYANRDRPEGRPAGRPRSADPIEDMVPVRGRHGIVRWVKP